jgi:hypothetical protein
MGSHMIVQKTLRQEHCGCTLNEVQNGDKIRRVKRLETWERGVGEGQMCPAMWILLRALVFTQRTIGGI